jgi:hypothetical protein
MNSPTPTDPGSLLPWYLNGTLTGRERDEVEIWLGSSEEAQSELLLWRAVQLDARHRPLADGGMDLGWRRLRGQLPAAPVAATRTASRQGWRWAAAASVLAILGLQTALLVRSPDDAIHRPLSVPATQVDSWQLQVRFADDTPLAELNALLLRYDATISEGPSALGLYTLSVPRGEDAAPDELVTRLRAEPRVLQVSVAP